jgi:hypothetical protein
LQERDESAKRVVLAQMSTHWKGILEECDWGLEAMWAELLSAIVPIPVPVPDYSQQQQPPAARANSANSSSNSNNSSVGSEEWSVLICRILGRSDVDNAKLAEVDYKAHDGR